MTPPSLQVAELGTVLGIWAHPDDEAYLCGGLMAHARDAGQRVVSVTATLGEHGTSDAVTWPPARLAAVRGHELRASLSVLGVTEHHVLGFPDGGCAAQDVEVAVGRLCRLLDDVRPDTVLTFGPDGLTGHPDHRAVSAWAGLARARAAPAARLLHASTTAEFADRWQDVHDRWDIYPADGLPLRVPEASVDVLLRLAEDVADRKLVALRAQASQTAALVADLGEDVFRDWCAVEAFVDAARVPVPA